MVLPSLSLADVGVLVTTLVVLGVPGAVVAVAAGLRGWRLAAVCPLLSLAVIGLGGPWSAFLGLRWSLATAAATTAVIALCVLPLGRLAARERPIAGPGPGPDATHPGHPAASARWLPVAHIGVALCVLVAAGVGVVAVLVGLGRLDAVLSGWDAGFHANGIRWILETGDGGVDAMMRVNWYEPGDERFYPNAYHLVCALVASLVPGAPVVAAMNAVTALTSGIGALGAAALVHRHAGRAVLAGAAALVVVAAGPVTGILSYGPLLPFALGVALLGPAIVIAVDVATTPTWARRMRDGALLALGATALFALHPGVIVTAVLFALPAVVAAWWRRGAPVLASLAVMLGAGALTALLCIPQVSGSLRSAAGPEVDWPAVLSPAEAVGQVAIFQHASEHPQVWIAVAVLVGVLCVARFGRLRWIVATSGIFGGLFVVAASFDTDWSLALTRPWWNDRFRLVAVAAVGLSVLGAHGLAEVHRRALARLPVDARLLRRHATAVSGTLAAVVLATFIVATDGLYLARFEADMRNNVGNGPIVRSPTVTPGERAGYAALAGLVPPDQRVMNDRRDGSLWMYALHGVHPVFGHYDATDVSADQLLLAARFNAYDTDPEVRAAAERLRVGWAVVGTGFVTTDAVREPGLEGLDQVRSLVRVYANPEVTVYRLVPRAPSAAAPEP